MANEYLQRTPTSTGNRRVFTWSGWVKLNNNPGSLLFTASPTKDNVNLLRVTSGGQVEFFDRQGSDASTEQVRYTPLLRDYGSWTHILINADTTQIDAANRVRAFVNGVELSRDATNTLLNNSAAVDTPPRNQEFWRLNGSGYAHYIGAFLDNSLNTTDKTQYSDVFFIDGQALTPDVFGFYKQGKGYISAGSTQATDFRPGQWVPKTPRVIKTEINRRGGFGVNGFYLPMNDSRNFGADFHGDPNSIITLNEKLPQPRVGVATTASVGLGYTDALRADPYAANLVLALPFVSGGLSSGFGDYAPSIKGSGSAKTITNNTSVSIANTHGYYGSSVYIDSVNYLSSSSADFAMGTGDFTVEGWINQTGGDTTYGGMFSTATSDSSGTGIVIARDQCWLGSNAVAVSVSAPGGTFWPLNQWTHIAFVRKTNTLTVFVNGVAAGITTNVTSNVGKTDAAIGRRYYNNSSFTPIAYIQDLRIYKGVAKYTGGFDVPKPYTPVGIATWRAVPDTTANNFATLNPLIEARPSSGTDSPSNSTIVTFAGGNLDLTNSASSGNAQRMYSFGTIGISTGRWYWEVRAGSNDAVAISKGFQQKNYGSNLGSGSGIEASVGYYGGGSVSIANTAYYSTATTLTPPTFDTTNIIGIAVSANSGSNNLTVQWFKDGIGVSTVTGIGATSPVLEWFPSRLVSGSGSGGDSKYNFGQNPTFSGNTTAGTFTDSNGKGLFKYQPPSGFLALCEDNLPTPAIADPGKHFKTVLWTGDGSNGRSIVGVGFTPDLIWYKPRNVTGYHGLVDSVRGAGIQMYSNDTLAESAGFYQSSFDPDGFGVNYNASGSTNNSGSTYVAWCWRAGAGTTSTNTSGSITSVVSVNQDAGFSIVSYTGTATAGTVGHGLNKKPKMVIVKRRDASTNWPIWFEGVSTNTDQVLQLNLTNGSASASVFFNSSNTTTTTFPLGTGGGQTNASGSPHIAYCWAEIEGFSKFGSYVGNGNADGPFVYCGFKPAWVLIKQTNLGTENWWINDSSRSSVNPANSNLAPNLSAIEDGSTLLDMLSNGFKIRNTFTSHNASGGSYIFAAFAESPFTTANAK